MGKDKLRRFAEMAEFPHVFEPNFKELTEKGFHLKGKWKKEFFKNDNPLVLELGCGKGEYTVGLSNLLPNRNYIGIDIKGARMWRGAKTVLENGQTNTAFIRTRIDLINHFFAENEVDEIWITFPDPQPRESREMKRLTSPRFLDRYKRLLKNQGIINLKTDNYPLHLYTVDLINQRGYKILKCTDDLYGNYLLNINDELEKSILGIKTTYEKLFSDKGFDITYVSFELDHDN